MSNDRLLEIDREIFLRQFAPVPPPPEVARVISRAMRDVTVAAGGVVFEKGDAPRDLFFIVEGELDLVGEDATMSFSKGAMVGIVDANVGRPHLRAAIAKTDVHLLALAYADWLDVLEDHPEFTSAARRSVANMTHEEIVQSAPTGSFDPPPPRIEGPPPASNVLMRLLTLRDVPIFQTASVQSLLELAERSQTRRVRKGEVAFAPGEAAGRIIVVMWGEVLVERRVAPVVLARFGHHQLVLGGAAFGTAASSYVITAETDALLMTIEFEDIDDVAEDHFDVVQSFLRSVTLERERFIVKRLKRASQPPSEAQKRPPELTIA
jgi:CRP-like cAMP-binding protein